MSNDKKKLILVTGGSGFIGSHCIVELINDGYDCVVVDNESNSTLECIKRVEQITGAQIPTHKVDICDKPALDSVFKAYKFHAVLHMAAAKNVGESVEVPLKYFKNNVTGTITLLEVMNENEVFNLVFSSSCTVYGQPQYFPIDEQHPSEGNNITSPYGKTKYINETVFKDLYASNKRWNIITLRYFNPAGAHESGIIGEDPQDPRALNLMPMIAQVAIGKRPIVRVFGSDYDTPDGTGIRDYIHISDLASGHSCAIKKLDEQPGFKVYNLGTGNGYSVLEMISAMEKATGLKIPYEICGRRVGDVARVFSDCKLAEKELGWKAKRGLNEMCVDLWRWQTKNPNGFLN